MSRAAPSSPARPRGSSRRRATTARRSATSPRRSGVQKGSLYSHIASKEDLLCETLQRGRGRLPRARSTGSPTTCRRSSKIRARAARPPARRRGAARRRHRVRPASGATSRARGARSSSPSGGATRSGSATLFREGRELGELRTDLDDAAAALLFLSAANWAYTWLQPGPRHRRARRPLLRAARRRDARLRDACVTRREHRPDRQSVRDARHRGRSVRALEERLARRVETLLTERKGHATELARGGSGDAVFVFGGDGLVNEVLNGLPAGKPLGIVRRRAHERASRARSACRATRRAGRAGERRISLGRVNGRRFSFAAGIGVDSETVRELETLKRAGTAGGAATSPTRESRRACCRRPVRRPARGRRPRPRGDAVRLEHAVVHLCRAEVAFRFSPRGALRARPRRRRAGTERCGDASRVFVRAPSPAGADVRQTGVLTGHDLDRDRRPLRRAAAAQADGEDLGDVDEAVFEAERDAVAVLVA